MAYPGSHLYSAAKKKGESLPDDEGGVGWIGYAQHAFECSPLPTDTLEPSDVLEFRDKAFTLYFENENYLGLLEKKFGHEVVEHVKDLSQHKLKRKILGHSQSVGK